MNTGRVCLTLAQRSHHLEALDRGVSGLQRLEPAHRADELLELAMVGLDDIVEVLHLPVARVFALQDGIVGEARIVERAFGVGPCALSEAIVWLQDHLASAET